MRHDAVSHRALMVVSIVGLNQVNETYGHATGDDLLLAVSARLKELFEDGGVVARIAANEFVLLSKPLKGSAEVLRLVQKLILTMEDPFRGLGNEIVVLARVGIASYPQDGRTARLLLRRADVAKRQAKTDGNSAFAFFDEGMEHNLMLSSRIGSALRGAIAQERIMPYFQPIVDLETGRTIAFECLARWNDPQLGWIGPDQFIRIAEESDQIGALSNNRFHRAVVSRGTGRIRSPCPSTFPACSFATARSVSTS
ncbi:diguanylate cyclase [Breoghania sp.]|uniref:diguanylate cyclase domain-containing protein n=1 Tax=Breoghania sp. TaxID=2065378 RepID=UPI00261E5541|nr:diguanylate cyclase [Breoghania sp.]MDJ0930314.1 diguanylate cyclase [Breoghania sp.]